jgi:hypothetical protein
MALLRFTTDRQTAAADTAQKTVMEKGRKGI